jgi:putative ABC transport system permease protein
MRQVYYFFADAARIALQSIFAQKLRTFLTLIGIIVGVASVVVVELPSAGSTATSFQRFQRFSG